MAGIYGISTPSVYRALRQFNCPHAIGRSDQGKPRVLPTAELEKYCELIAALKLRTMNKKGRHVSTVKAIELLEEHGVETLQGLVQVPKGLLSRSTVNRYLSLWHLDHPHLLKEPVAVRFQAEHSNDCWQFDLSPSDLKHLDIPEWVEPFHGKPTLMLFSVVDDRSGVSYQEYHCVYGEDTESALRFLFNAMAPKPQETFAFQGRPAMIYLDNGPIAKSRLFKNVMLALGIHWQTHQPENSDGTRTTARSKGKVERPFRTVKEAHETLYHFHQPETEQQANAWLLNYLIHYNNQCHRSEKHSRFEDWVENLPPEGIREMCSWEQFCRFAREPERRKVGIDAHVTIEGTVYELEPDMAGETVVLLWGLFDDELYAEYDGERSGPYKPISGPIPLHRYRKFKASKTSKRADKIRTLAQHIHLPITALSADTDIVSSIDLTEIPRQSFNDELPDICFPNPITAKMAIASELALPLTKLDTESQEFIERLLSETLSCDRVISQVRDYFRQRKSGGHYAR
ncbi:transposase family protein [Xenorhabdus sp. DI]|nr:transposase family protein [Xenorhabdus sp. 3]MBD2790004.1 transposase family protein [Xenorhabdus sp. DI]